MLKFINRKSLNVSAGVTAGMLMASAPAHANNFSNIAGNMGNSLNDLPGLVSALSYLFGTLLGVLGVMKIKDHVENPAQTPLKDGAIRLAAGGALFALPMIFEAMFNTVGNTATVTGPAAVKATSFNVT